MSLPDRVLRTAEQHKLFAAGQSVVVAVSGGPDSVALLHCLHALRETWPITLTAAHLDHGFRGAESAADADYVRALCDRLEIACRATYENVPEQKKQMHLSSQEAARRVRHAFLRRVAKEVGADRIALGHTRDDRAETILLNLFRGTGPDGLAGFPAVRLPLVRPLYDVSRAETVEYCALHGLSPRTDPSNTSLYYGRNRIRHELLPYLATHFNPRISDALLRMADLVSVDNEALAADARRCLALVRREHGTGSIVLSADTLAHGSLALQRRTLRLAISEIRGDLHGIDQELIAAVLHAAARRERLVVQLPQDGSPACRISLDPDSLTVALERVAAAPAKWRVELPAEGEAALPQGGRIATRVFAGIGEARRALERIEASGPVPDALLFPLAAVRLPLAARSWSKGDRMRPRGMSGTKKLQDIFVDGKTPSKQRAYVPVIVESGSDERILGVLGVQGGEFSLPLAPGVSRAEIIGPCLLIMALSDSGVT